jgi:GTP-binding protein LepA
MDIVQERLEREYGLTLIATAPSVVYRVTRTNGEIYEIDNPAKMPNPHELEQVEEPTVVATIIVPPEYVGPCWSCANRGVACTKAWSFRAAADA